jgi:hypothetical protein
LSGRQKIDKVRKNQGNLIDASITVPNDDVDNVFLYGKKKEQ